MRVRITSKQAWGVAALATGILVVGLLFGRLLGVAPLVYAVAIPLGILFGWVGAIGFAVGNLLRDLTLGTAGPSSVIRLVGDLLLVAIGVASWGVRAPPTHHDRPRALLGGLWAYAISAVVASLWSVAFVASGMTLVGGTAFGNSAAALVVDRAVPVTVFGPFVLLGLASVMGRRPAIPLPSFRPSGRTRIGVLVVGASWLGGGLALSLVRRDVASLPGAGVDFAAYLPDGVGPVALFVIGPLYPVVLASLAVLALVAGFFLLDGRPGTISEQPNRHHSPYH